MFATLVAMLLPFFNAVLGLIGALAAPRQLPREHARGEAQDPARRGPVVNAGQAMSLVCLISIAANVGSVQDIVHNLKVAAPFKTYGQLIDGLID